MLKTILGDIATLKVDAIGNSVNRTIHTSATY
jgi:O-acetyl-ADP-ribose deacetylase (regulator of RNase III)